MKFLIILLVVVGSVACSGGSAPAAPSVKHVDSAVSVAPDTIKALPLDSPGGAAADTVKR